MISRLQVIDVAPSTTTQPLCDAVFRSLSQPEKALPCRFFYDETGSEIFEKITDLPEYYLTRCETEILTASAGEILRRLDPGFSIVEFGSGSSIKTRLLISAALELQDELEYVPIDISREFLIRSASELLTAYKGLSITAIAAEYSDAIVHLPHFEGPRLILFLGSNIGNFTREQAIEFLKRVASQMRPQDRLLLGADLIKDPEVLHAAYNDAQGVTAEFNLNLLRRINAELQANFDLDGFEHLAPFVPERSRVEMRLISKKRQVAYVEDLQTEFSFDEGEVITTEFSHKYSPESIARLSAEAGLEVVVDWRDTRGYFAEFLLKRSSGTEGGQASRKRDLIDRLSQVRERTLSLMREVSDEFLRRRVHDFYSPIGWHFGHVGRTEEYWVCKATGTEPSDAALSFIYADLADNPKNNRVNIPDRAGTLAYLASTRQFALDVLERTNLETKDPFLRDGYAWEFAIQHECQHHETIAEMLLLIQQQIGLEETEPSPLEPVPWRPSVVGRMIEHPAGRFVMGSPDIHGYDNEKDAHAVSVEAFELAEYPTTCFEWSEFMAEGGYRRQELWSEEGWAWKEAQNASWPYYWVLLREGYGQFGPFGARALHPDEPVMAISQFEAEAYAKWKGMRLPTEAEWEYAASAAGSEGKRIYAWGKATPDDRRACHTLSNWGPIEVGAAARGRTPLGVSDMSGNVWEWTSSRFLPYPGFEAFPYDGYSKDHMLGGHFVCRGGSWATSPIILRNTFRNWYVPSYRQGFLGVRLASG